MRILVFNSDEDFEFYALKPDFVIKESITPGSYYYDAEFTDAYLHDILNDVHFCINNRDSKIFRRGYVSKGAISKRVTNLLLPDLDSVKEDYFDAEFVYL